MRSVAARVLGWLAVAFVVAGVFANAYPFAPKGSTEMLTALHLPIALWLVVGIAIKTGSTPPTPRHAFPSATAVRG